MLLEVDLEEPILALKLGTFSTPGTISLAVLFPSHLAVYNLVPTDGAHVLTLLHDHNLDHTAAALVVGRFGQVHEDPLDHLCVLSMDGQLVFFRGPRRLFHRYLRKFLVPGPIQYCPALDAFVLTNSALEVELFPYSQIVAATAGEHEKATSNHDHASARGGVGVGGGRPPTTAASGRPPLASGMGLGGGTSTSTSTSTFSSAAALGTSEPPTSETPASRGKEVSPSWTWVMGEHCTDLLIAPSLHDESRTSHLARALTSSKAKPVAGHGVNIAVLGERHLFVLDGLGQCVRQIKLDYHPVAMAMVLTPSPVTGVNYHLVVAAHTGMLLVYQGTKLVWGAKSDLVPAALGSTCLDGIEGLVWMASDAGRVEVVYMGTDPPLNVVQVVEGPEVDFEAADDEHHRLLERIRNHMSAVHATPTEVALALRTNVPLQCDRTRSEQDGEDIAELSDPMARHRNNDQKKKKKEALSVVRRRLTVSLVLTNHASRAIHDVRVQIGCPAGVSCATPEVSYDHLASGTGGVAEPTHVSLKFSTDAQLMPTSTTVTCAATYTTHAGEQRACVHTFDLPLPFFAEAVPPVKESNFKLILEINRDPPQLAALFDDLLAASDGYVTAATAQNVLSMRLATDEVASVVVSRSGGRFRVQGDSFATLWLPLQELVHRLENIFAGDGSLTITFDDPLPLGDLFDVMDRHLEARTAYQETMDELERRTAQFRSVQKRLLVRFKDRSPEPLQHLDELLHDTHRQIHTLAGRARAQRHAVRVLHGHLCGSVRLVLLLARLHYRLPARAAGVLEALVSPQLAEGHETSWEQLTQSSASWALTRMDGGLTGGDVSS